MTTRYDHKGAHACAMSDLLWNNTVTPETRQYLTANHNAAMAEIAELRQALQAAIETIKWMNSCTSPAQDEITQAIANAERILK